MQSVMSHQFSQVPAAEIPRSSFDRSHGCKTTFDAGELIIVFADEALPGDTMNLRMTAFGRLSTPLHPFMDNLFVDSFFFAVPVRLIWDNFQKFNGEETNPGDSTDFLVPTMTSPGGGYAELSLSDYLGIPTKIASLTHMSLYHRAYNFIWNEWFRDENMQNSVVVDTDDGPDLDTDYAVLKRGKRHDYFTSALPWPQKGPAVTIPLSGTAPVVGIGTQVTGPATGTSDNIYQTDIGAGTFPTVSGGSNVHLVLESTGNASPTNLPQVYADLSSATAATINALRQSFQIQKLYERDARGGTRYTEIIRAHFGVVSPDSRLQRPEYLGGGSSPINVNPVAQTSSTDATTPQANLAAIGTVQLNGHGFTKSFTEHTILLGMVSVRADLNYQQGLNRQFKRSTRWDYYWPALSHIGEQSVLQGEIFADGTANDDIVFGYQERFAEYRYKPSIITGVFRSNATASLDTWHLAQDFASAPVLGDTFIKETPPVARIVAVTSEPEILFDTYFNYICARPMPVYSVPGLIDHF